MISRMPDELILFKLFSLFDVIVLMGISSFINWIAYNIRMASKAGEFVYHRYSVRSNYSLRCIPNWFQKKDNIYRFESDLEILA